MADNTTSTAFHGSGSPSGPAPTARKMTAGRVLAVVIGCFLLLPGFGMLLAGGSAAIGQAVVTDDDGYWDVTLDRVQSDGVAIAVSTDQFDDDDEASDWMLEWLDLDIRLVVEGARTTDEVFVGIARSDDVDRYLSGAAHSEIIEMDGRTAQYRIHRGSDDVEPPLSQDFWVEHASGSGIEELAWEARGGNWSAVVMNADGSPVVAADVETGVRPGLVMPIAIGLLVLGGLVTIAGIVLIVIGARGKKVPLEASMPYHRQDQPLAPPTPQMAVALDEERTKEPVS